MQHVVTLYDETYVVFDLEKSQLVDFLKRDYLANNPFTDIKDPKVVVDIGANIGMWAFWVAKRYPQAHVYAIEPHPINFMHLQAGMQASGLHNVSAFPCAVSHKAELVPLWLDVTNSGATGRYNEIYPHTTPSLATALPLNTLFETIHEPYVDYVKVDIEGGEFDLFEDFAYWDKVGALYVEVHPFPRYKNKQDGAYQVEAFKALLHDEMGDKPFVMVGDIPHESYAEYERLYGH